MEHYLELATIPNAAVRSLLQSAHQLKAEWREGGNHARLHGQILGMIFEKPSLRTRVSFDVAMLQLGGHALMLGPQEIGINSRETTADIAACHLTLCRRRDAAHLFAFHHSGICRV